MRISVVIPVYNEEKYIEKCLTSLNKQSIAPDEIIIVDNNCTDSTIDIAKRFKGIRIIKERKQGIAYARNRGFDEARGDVIARCDADSILRKDWIKKIRWNFKKRRMDALIGPLVFYDLPFRTTIGVKLYILLMTKILNHYPLNGPNMAISKEMWKKIHDVVCVNDKEMHEDIDLAIHVNDAGGEVGYDSSLVVPISARRLKYNPKSFFIEYPFRLAKMLKSHK